MMAEHDIEGERYRHIEHLTNGYTAPEDACNSYRLVLQQLKAFEEALHQHIHLENNIVFPRSIKMEAKLREQP
jgi:regulator of cell morphogenesis and NO signaling